MNPCAAAVDTMWMERSTSGTPVDEVAECASSGDERLFRPRSVLTPVTPLTCEDVRSPQFPHPLLLRRIVSLRAHAFIGPGDDRRAA